MTMKKKAVYGVSEDTLMAMSSEEMVELLSRKKEAWRKTRRREKKRISAILRYRANPEKANRDKSNRRKANPEKYRATDRAWYQKNAEKERAATRAQYRKHAEKRKAEARAWRKIHPHYDLYRRQTDLQFKLAKNLRTRLNSALKGNFKRGSAVRDLGCSIAELKTHLEKQFQPGMSWKNWGKEEGCWQIDHIVDLNRWDLRDPLQIKEACRFENLRPLWRHENLSRSRTRKSKTPKVA